MVHDVIVSTLLLLLLLPPPPPLLLPPPSEWINPGHHSDRGAVWREASMGGNT